ncbi:MAG: maltose alpha-D-glucosyltransferase [Chloroflexaceae bacterium]
MTLSRIGRSAAGTGRDGHWYKDAIIYEVHVRAFHDSNEDGIGDFCGLTEKLDYLYHLGITAIWLLPFYPSPLKDDGYDISDYTGIHPDYGTLEDFRHFLDAAHQRGLRVITELVLNHTSDQHPWFQRARRAAPGSEARNFYVWSDTGEQYAEARVIFQDFENSNWSWDAVAQTYYWHRFYHHQPDLNYANPRVLEAMAGVMEFWLKLGVDGIRLDAVPYLAEATNTNCENLPETHAILKQLRRHVDERFAERMFLAEANQWPEDAVAYFGAGDECHMAFHFPLMPRLFMGVRQETRFPIVDILAQTPEIPDNCQWAVFLRNHDELTLEMVTEEERLYMYQAFAHDPAARVNLGIRRRLAPLLSNHRRRIELLHSLLFAFPGTPVIYYGDEIGMGDNIYLGDRDGVRTPMQWNADRNAGFSRAHPQQLYLPLIVDHEYHHETLHVEAQQVNPHSLLCWLQQMIGMRKRYKAFGRGSIELLHPENRKILAFIRRYQDEVILIVANLSRFTQYVELDLRDYAGQVPFELFGRTPFPTIGELPYLLTLGPHSFHWFALEPAGNDRAVLPPGATERPIPRLRVADSWEDLVWRNARADLEAILPDYFRTQPWFTGWHQTILSMTIQEVITVSNEAPTLYICLIRVEYSDADPETYTLPLTCTRGETARYVRERFANAIIAEIEENDPDDQDDPAEPSILYDAIWDLRFNQALVTRISHQQRLLGTAGVLTGTPTPVLASIQHIVENVRNLRILQRKHANTAAAYDEHAVLKLFRRIDEGTNPDLELGQFLTEQGFAHSPAIAGDLTYQRRRTPPMTLAILQQFMGNQGDAWHDFLEDLHGYFERVAATAAERPAVPGALTTLLEQTDQELPALAHELIGDMLTKAQLLGQRTADLHHTLAADPDNPSFAPEPFNSFYQRSVYQTARALSLNVLDNLRRRRPTLPNDLQEDARRLLEQKAVLIDEFHTILERTFTGMRIRCHNNYHLKQVLCADQDFTIIDFEGEPQRPLFERRLKRSPLRDVAGMLRSFHYAAHVALAKRRKAGQHLEDGEAWVRYWQHWVSVAFLQRYCALADGNSLLPRTTAEMSRLLKIFLLERGMYELEYELTNRPDWVAIPLRDLLYFLQRET